MSINTKIKVLIVDDHAMVRRGLIVLFENFDEFEIVADTASGHTALIACQKYHPDVVLMDLLMPEMSGIEAIEHIHASCPDVRIIVLTSELNEQLLYKALQAGAISYLLKTGSIDEVAEAVRRAYKGQSSLAPQAISTLIAIQQQPSDIGAKLTARERTVLGFMIQGLTNRQIAEQLFITMSTVRDHLHNIYSILKVHTRAKAVALAIQSRILEEM